MRVYIAYKYRAIENKDELKKDLELISATIDQLQHKPFVLGRDIQKWHSSSSSVFRTIPHIIINIAKSDLLFAFITSDVKSWGLHFELFCAKIFNKPIIIAKKFGLIFDTSIVKPKTVIEFTDIEDLVSKINDLTI